MSILVIETFQRIFARFKNSVEAEARREDSPTERARTLRRLGRMEQAVVEYRAILAGDPDNARARIDLGSALTSLGQLEEARAELERALRIAPDYADAHHHLGVACHRLGELDRAIAAIGRAHELAPENIGIHSSLLFILNYSARHGARQIFAEHRRFGELHVQPVASPRPNPAWPRRLRVGYVSADFRSHVVSSFMLPILARHDRERFDVYCYYTFPQSDSVTEGMRALADDWSDCAGLSDAELCARIRGDRIDILVDLAGHTLNHSLTVFALRPAPLQLTYLGYPNTTGLSAIDCRITDAKADPPGEADAVNVERLVRLPRTFLCYRPGPDLQVPLAPPASISGSVTFGCFNNFQKLSEPFFTAAARILAAVPDSRLLLKAEQLDIPSAAQRVRERFTREGIDPARLELLGWAASPEEHLATYRKVDIALDSFPYNGTTTTCEALWMSVPVISVCGDRHAGRVGASLLQTVGLGELLARDTDEYVQIAARLAGDLSRLAALRAGLRERVRASPLRDETGFVRELETCYLALWQEKLRATAVKAPRPLDSVTALRAAGKAREAKSACEEILRDQPAREDALALLWDLCHELGENVAAVDALGRAVGAGGGSARVYYMLGCTMQDLARDDDAMSAYRKALELDPAHAKAENNLGCLLEVRGDVGAAAQCYDRALRADPGLANAYYNRGNLAKLEGRADAAEADLKRALELEPGHADWHSSLADLYLLNWRLDEAAGQQRAAIALEPRLTQAHFGLGNALMMLSHAEEAEACFRRAISLQPEFAEAHSNLLLCLHYRMSANREALFQEHLTWAARHAQGLRQALGHPGIERKAGRRLNIGYLSPNFHSHSVASFLEPLLAAHDRNHFRIFAYANVERPDAVTERLKALCDEWRDLRGVGADEAARLIREDRIDILVDLAGHTGGGRPLVLARKPAPVQIAWLGYPDTTGLAEVDYRLTDAEADPRNDADRYYTEKLLRLPQGFLCFAPDPGSPEPGEPPAGRNGFVTFGCFNNLAKVSPEVIALWSKVLAAAPGARLLLKAHALGCASAHMDVTKVFAQHGIDAHRLSLFGPEDTAMGHLSRYREVDIALDTFPYNGTTTTCEALWMGVPVVTLAGSAHVSRVGASILTRIGLSELVTPNAGHYVATALALATDRARLRELRQSLRQRMRASPLLDGAKFARAVEAAYQQAWSAWVAAPPRAAVAPVNGDVLRLHVGGQTKKTGWKIFNIQPLPGVDFIGDCTDLGQFASGSVQEIYASHVLEHLDYQAALPRALAEFHRVLRPGGRAMISVPDFETLCRLFLDPRAGAAERYLIMRMAYGGQLDEHDFHRVGLTHEILSGFLKTAGFSRIERVPDFGIFEDSSTVEVLGERISLNVVAHK